MVAWLRWLLASMVLIGAMPYEAYGKITLKASRRVVQEGEQFALEVETTDRQEFNRIKSIPGLDKFEVVSQSSTTRMQFINGKYSSMVGTSYILLAKEAGRFAIGPIAVKMGKKTVKSNRIKIAVNAVKVDPNAPRMYFLKAAIEPGTSYLNQQVSYILKFYFRQTFFQPKLTTPDFKGFWREGEAVQKDYTERIGEVTYKVKEIRLAMFPQQAGMLSIEPTRFTIETRIAGAQGRPFDPFQATPTRRINLKSNAVTLRVKEIAQPGLTTPYVGSLRVRSSALPKSAKVGDSINLTVTVEGTGNVRDIAMPKLAIKGARLYGDKPVQEFDQNAQGVITGKRTFSVAIVPEQPGTLKVPKMTFTALDPASGRIIRSTVPATTIQVAAGGASSTGAATAVTPSAPNSKPKAKPKAKPVAVLGTDIESAPLPFGKRLSPLPSQGFPMWFWAGVGGIGLILVGLVVTGAVPDWRQRLKRRSARQGAYKSAMAQLGAGGSGELTAVVRRFLELKLERSLPAASPREMVAVVAGIPKIPQAVVDRLQQCFDSAEKQRYSRSGVTTDAHEQREVGAVLKQLDRALS